MGKQRRKGSGIGKLAWLAGAAAVAVLVWLAGSPGKVPAGPLGPDSPRRDIVAAARAGRISSLWKGGETQATLDPARFEGRTFEGLDVAAGYRVAREIPQVLDELFCYCYCALNHGHKSLLSCYTDLHASECWVCLAEAQRASELYEQGKPLPEIERAIDREFSRT